MNRERKALQQFAIENGIPLHHINQESQLPANSNSNQHKSLYRYFNMSYQHDSISAASNILQRVPNTQKNSRNNQQKELFSQADKTKLRSNLNLHSHAIPDVKEYLVQNIDWIRNVEVTVTVQQAYSEEDKQASVCGKSSQMPTSEKGNAENKNWYDGAKGNKLEPQNIVNGGIAPIKGGGQHMAAAKHHETQGYQQQSNGIIKGSSPTLSKQDDNSEERGIKNVQKQIKYSKVVTPFNAVAFLPSKDNSFSVNPFQDVPPYLVLGYMSSVHTQKIVDPVSIPHTSTTSDAPYNSNSQPNKVLADSESRSNFPMIIRKEKDFSSNLGAPDQEQHIEYPKSLSQQAMKSLFSKKQGNDGVSARPCQAFEGSSDYLESKDNPATSAWKMQQPQKIIKFNQNIVVSDAYDKTATATRKMLPGSAAAADPSYIIHQQIQGKKEKKAAKVQSLRQGGNMTSPIFSTLEIESADDLKCQGIIKKCLEKQRNNQEISHLEEYKQNEKEPIQSKVIKKNLMPEIAIPESQLITMKNGTGEINRDIPCIKEGKKNQSGSLQDEPESNLLNQFANSRNPYNGSLPSNKSRSQMREKSTFAQQHFNNLLREQQQQVQQQMPSTSPTYQIEQQLKYLHWLEIEFCEVEFYGKLPQKQEKSANNCDSAPQYFRNDFNQTQQTPPSKKFALINCTDNSGCEVEANQNFLIQKNTFKKNPHQTTGSNNNNNNDSADYYARINSRITPKAAEQSISCKFMPIDSHLQYSHAIQDGQHDEKRLSEATKQINPGKQEHGNLIQAMAQKTLTSANINSAICYPDKYLIQLQASETWPKIQDRKNCNVAIQFTFVSESDYLMMKKFLSNYCAVKFPPLSKDFVFVKALGSGCQAQVDLYRSKLPISLYSPQAQSGRGYPATPNNVSQMQNDFNLNEAKLIGELTGINQSASRRGSVPTRPSQLQPFNQHQLAKLQNNPAVAADGNAGNIGNQSFEKYAVKKIVLDKDLKSTNRMFLFNEVRHLRELRACENICELQSVHVTSNQETGEKQYYLVLKFAKYGTLFQFYNAHRCFTEEMSRKVLLQLLLSLDFMHKRGYYHRDIKGDNVLIMDRKQLKVCISDLGFTCRSDDERSLKLRCGTPGYIPPELFKGHHFTNKADIFSTGVLLFTLVAGKHLYDGHDAKDVLKANASIDPSEMILTQVKRTSIECKNLLMQMLQTDPKKRFSAEQCLHHPWFKHDQEVILSGLAKNRIQFLPQIFGEKSPSDRGGPNKQSVMSPSMRNMFNISQQMQSRDSSPNNNDCKSLNVSSFIVTPNYYQNCRGSPSPSMANGNGMRDSQASFGSNASSNQGRRGHNYQSRDLLKGTLANIKGSQAQRNQSEMDSKRGSKCQNVLNSPSGACKVVISPESSEQAQRVAQRVNPPADQTSALIKKIDEGNGILEGPANNEEVAIQSQPVDNVIGKNLIKHKRIHTTFGISMGPSGVDGNDMQASKYNNKLSHQPSPSELVNAAKQPAQAQLLPQNNDVARDYSNKEEQIIRHVNVIITNQNRESVSFCAQPSKNDSMRQSSSCHNTQQQQKPNIITISKFAADCSLPETPQPKNRVVNSTKVEGTSMAYKQPLVQQDILNVGGNKKKEQLLTKFQAIGQQQSPAKQLYNQQQEVTIQRVTDNKQQLELNYNIKDGSQIKIQPLLTFQKQVPSSQQPQNIDVNQLKTLKRKFECPDYQSLEEEEIPLGKGTIPNDEDDGCDDIGSYCAEFTNPTPRQEFNGVAIQTHGQGAALSKKHSSMLSQAERWTQVKNKLYTQGTNQFPLAQFNIATDYKVTQFCKESVIKQEQRPNRTVICLAAPQVHTEMEQHSLYSDYRQNKNRSVCHTQAAQAFQPLDGMKACGVGMPKAPYLEPQKRSSMYDLNPQVKGSRRIHGSQGRWVFDEEKELMISRR